MHVLLALSLACAPTPPTLALPAQGLPAAAPSTREVVITVAPGDTPQTLLADPFFGLPASEVALAGEQLLDQLGDLGFRAGTALEVNIQIETPRLTRIRWAPGARDELVFDRGVRGDWSVRQPEDRWSRIARRREFPAADLWARLADIGPVARTEVTEALNAVVDPENRRRREDVVVVSVDEFQEDGDHRGWGSVRAVGILRDGAWVSAAARVSPTSRSRGWSHATGEGVAPPLAAPVTADGVADGDPRCPRLAKASRAWWATGGSDVRVFADGEVRSLTPLADRAGSRVVVGHAPDVTSVYAPVLPAPGIRPGVSLAQGQPLGTVPGSGRSCLVAAIDTPQGMLPRALTATDADAARALIEELTPPKPEMRRP